MKNLDGKSLPGSHNVCIGYFCSVYKDIKPDQPSVNTQRMKETDVSFCWRGDLVPTHSFPCTCYKCPLPWWSAQSSYIWCTGLHPCNRHKQGLIMVTVFQQKHRLCWSPWFGVLRTIRRMGGGTQLLTIYSIVTKTNATDGNTSSTSLQITHAKSSAASEQFCIFLPHIYFPIRDTVAPKKPFLQMYCNYS